MFIHAKLCLTDLRLTSLTKSGVRVCGPDDVYFRHMWPGTQAFSESMGRHAWIPDNNKRVHSFHGCYT